MQSPRDMIGKTLQGKLMITELLGEGAMGVVYRGFDAELLQHVAIKVLQPELAVHPAVVARFYREGSAARRVDHKNTVRFLGRGQDAGIHFLVMELLDGQSLGALLHVERRVDQERAVRMVVQVCDALAVAHERGVVHRDLKPDNVMVSGKPGDALGEHVKLVDFGIAKRVGSIAGIAVRVEDSFNNGDELTACGALIGTPEYMAPEQCRGLEVDARTDVYACGVMLYRMVTGEVPFTASHPLEVCQLHLGEAPRPPSALAPDLHGAIEAVILKAMNKDPKDRPASALDLRDDLVRALATIEAEREAAVSKSHEEIVDALACTLAAPLVVMMGEMPKLPAEPVAMAPPSAPPVPRVSAQIAISAEPRRARKRVPSIPTCVALSAGMASMLMMLGALLHH